MKRLILPLLIVIAALHAQAQWTTSGTNIYNSNTGAVTIGSTSVFANKFNVIGDAFINNRYYYRNQYSVPPATYVPINLTSATDNSLTAQLVYRVELVTTGTGASTGSVYIIRQSGASTWVAKPVSLVAGGTNNSPLLRVNAGKVEIYHTHTATYNVMAYVTTTVTGNVTITGPSFFGLEGSMTSYNDNIGIGMDNPSHKLSIVGRTSTINNAEGFTHFDNSSANSAYFATKFSGTDFWLTTSKIGTGVTDANLIFAPAGTEKMRVTSTGEVAIGTTCVPSGYKMAIKGNIICEKLKVKPEGGNCWADYVFEKNYNLLKLSEVEQFIAKNKHLPGVPSAADVAENGIEMVEMDATLLKKIEELTLYMIELKKENELLKARVSSIEEKR